MDMATVIIISSFQNGSFDIQVSYFNYGIFTHELLLLKFTIYLPGTEKAQDTCTNEYCNESCYEQDPLLSGFILFCFIIIVIIHFLS